MQKIGNITATATSDGQFTNGSVASGVSPTILDAAWFNTIQNEIVNTIQSAGIALDPKDDGQLVKAVKKAIDSAITALSLGAAASRNIGTGANQIPDMSSFTSTLNTPGVMRFPGGFTFMWALGGTDSSGVANTALPASFPNACLGALAIERNPYAWGQGQTSTFAVQINALTKNTVQALGRQISSGSVTAVSGVGCLVLAWGY